MCREGQWEHPCAPSRYKSTYLGAHQAHLDVYRLGEMLGSPGGYTLTGAKACLLLHSTPPLPAPAALVQPCPGRNVRNAQSDTSS